jgi:hypothetical protein
LVLEQVEGRSPDVFDSSFEERLLLSVLGAKLRCPSFEASMFPRSGSPRARLF